MRNSFLRLAVIACVALISTQSAAIAQSEDDVTALNRQAVQLYNQGKYAEATELAERSLSLAERMFGPEHASTLKSVNNLAFLYQEQGRYGEAEPLYERALATREKTLGPEHPDTLASVANLGSLYQARGSFDEAEPLLKRALAGRKKVLGPEHRDTLLSVNNLAFLYQLQGRYGEAEPLLKLALAGYETELGPEHPDTLTIVGNLGFICQEQGRYAEAELLLKRALAGREKVLGPEHLSTLLSVNNLAFLYQVQDRNGEADALFRRALAGYEKALGPEHPDTLRSAGNLGFFLYKERGRYGEAEPLLRRAVTGYEKALGPEHPDTLRHVHNLAFLYRAQDRNAEAEPLLKRVLAGFEKALGPEHADTLTIAGNLGFFYQAQGRYSEAEPLLKRALAGYEKVLGPEHPDTITNVNNLAALYFAQGNWQEAAQYWRRSTVAIAKRVQRDARGAELIGEKTSEAQQSDWQFWGLVKAVHRMASDGRMPDASLTGEMFQTAQLALSSEAARSLAQMAVRGAKGDPALAAVLRERQDLVDEWQRREKFQTAALGQETANRNAAAEADNNERMAVIDGRIAEIDAELKDKFPDYAALADPAPLAVEEVQKQLGTDEALVLFLATQDWLSTPEETYIWIVTKDEIRWVRSELGRAGLAREVQALRCGLDYSAWEERRCHDLTGQQFALSEYAAGKALPFDHLRANRLYESLFGQVKDLIEGKHLLIVPAGALTQLPFSVLVTEPPETEAESVIAWLVRDHAVTILPAVSSLNALRRVSRPSNASRSLIGFGNPLLNGPGGFHSVGAKLARDNQSCPQTLWQRITGFLRLDRGLTQIEMRGGLADPAEIRQASPLPETTDELCAVARSLGADADELRLGARATEREVKALSESGGLAQYRIVHFATHGAMAGELRDDAEPGLILTPPDQATEEDDGYLSASEIAALKLDADWVILSACNTGAGSTANAEALSGLARAFIYAQTRALLVSHWYVDSLATVALVTAAIGEIGADQTVGRAEALRRAMLSLIDSGDANQAHPSRWAPFIVVGEGAK